MHLQSSTVKERNLQLASPLFRIAPELLDHIIYYTLPNGIIFIGQSERRLPAKLLKSEALAKTCKRMRTVIGRFVYNPIMVEAKPYAFDPLHTLFSFSATAQAVNQFDTFQRYCDLFSEDAALKYEARFVEIHIDCPCCHHQRRKASETPIRCSVANYVLMQLKCFRHLESVKIISTGKLCDLSAQWLKKSLDEFLATKYAFAFVSMKGNNPTFVPLVEIIGPNTKLVKRKSTMLDLTFKRPTKFTFTKFVQQVKWTESHVCSPAQ